MKGKMVFKVVYTIFLSFGSKPQVCVYSLKPPRDGSTDRQQSVFGVKFRKISHIISWKKSTVWALKASNTLTRYVILLLSTTFSFYFLGWCGQGAVALWPSDNRKFKYRINVALNVTSLVWLHSYLQLISQQKKEFPNIFFLFHKYFDWFFLFEIWGSSWEQHYLYSAVWSDKP